MQVRTLDHPVITAMQKQHFVLLDILPLLGTIGSFVLLYWFPPSLADWAVFAFMWYATVTGIELGYHRYFSHGAFKTTEPIRALLAILGSMGGQGSVVTWASTHKHHHNYSDTADDVHSPYYFRGKQGVSFRSLLHSQLMWKWRYPYPNPSLYTPKLVRDPTLIWVSRYYYGWLLLSLAIPGLMCGLIAGSWQHALTGVLLGGIIRLYLVQQTTFLINSLCHLHGSRPFPTKDQSRNVAWLVPVTLGGSLHNCHHAFASTANNGVLRWQIDPGYWIIGGLELFGLAWDVRTVSPEIAAKRLNLKLHAHETVSEDADLT